MADEIKMAVSHDQGPAPLGPDDYQQLFDLSMKGDPRAAKIAATLSPTERQEFFNFQQASHKGKDATSNRKDGDMFSVGSFGVSPEMALGGAGAVRAVSGSMPSLSGLPGAVKAGVGGYLGYEGAQSIGKAVGLPGPLRDILALMASHHAAGAASGIGGEAEAAAAKYGTSADKIAPKTMPMSDAEYAAAGGTDRFGVAGSVARPADPTGGELTPAAKFPSMEGQPASSPFQRPHDAPPNLTFKRTNADLAEQVKRGVQNDFNGMVHIEKPPAMPGVSAPNGVKPPPPTLDPAAQARRDQTARVGSSEGEKEGADSLATLLKAIGSDKSKGNGTGPALGDNEVHKSLASQENPNFDEMFQRARRTPRPPEYPAGTNSKTKPEKYEEAQKTWAEENANYDAFADAQKRIREKLDAAGAPDNSRRSKMRKVK